MEYLSVSTNSLPEDLNLSVSIGSVFAEEDFTNRICAVETDSIRLPQFTFKFSNKKGDVIEIYTTSFADKNLLSSPLRGTDMQTKSENSLMMDACSVLFGLGYDSLFITPKLGEGGVISISDPEFESFFVSSILQLDTLHKSKVS